MVIGTIADLGGGMFDALNSLRKAIEASGDKLQKASLALGKTFDQTNAEITPAMEGLRGSLDQRIGAGIAGLQAGLQGNTAGVAKLINQQQLTGTSFANTATAMASLSQTLNVSNDDINGLSTRLIETAGTYSVSTDKLVTAVDALKDTFPTQQLAGMGMQVTEAMASLTARMPAMAGQVTSVMKMILDPSLKTEANLARLGIAGVRERLASAKDAKAAEAILVSAIKTAGGNITDFVSGDFFASIGIATSVFGENAAAMAAINTQLEKRIKNEKATMDFGDTIQAIRDSMLVPLQRVLQTDFYPAIKKISEVLSGIGERFAAALAKWIKKLDFSEKSILGFTDSVVDAAISLTTGLEAVINFLINLSNNTLPRITAMFEKLAMWYNDTMPEFMGGGSMNMYSMLNDIDRMRASKQFAGDDMAQNAYLSQLAYDRWSQMGQIKFGTTEDVNFSLIRTSLLDLKSDSEEDLDIQKDIRDGVREINDKTLDPFGDTADSYLANTAMNMQALMGSILGQTPQDQLEETNNILTAMLAGQGSGWNPSAPTHGL